MALQSDNLEDQSSWFSYIFLTYLDPIFVIGNSRALEFSDLKGIADQDRSDKLYAKFAVVWEKELTIPRKKRYLWPVIWKTVGYTNVSFAVLLFAISAAFQIAPIYILNLLVRYFSGLLELSTTIVWLLVCLLFVLPLVSSITLAHSNILMVHIGAQVRNLLIGIIYRKTLRLSSAGRQFISTGRIVTMFSADTNQMKTYFLYFNNFYCAPLSTAN